MKVTNHDDIKVPNTASYIHDNNFFCCCVISLLGELRFTTPMFAENRPRLPKNCCHKTLSPAKTHGRIRIVQNTWLENKMIYEGHKKKTIFCPISKALTQITSLADKAKQYLNFFFFQIRPLEYC